MTLPPIAAGQVFDVAPFPFVRHVATVLDADGDPEDIPCWKPGCNQVNVPPDDSEPQADGQGTMRLTVVSVHTPPGFPQRVFYLRTWIDPDGKTFGRRRLIVCVTPAFRRRASGYLYGYRLTATREWVDGTGYR